MFSTQSRRDREKLVPVDGLNKNYSSSTDSSGHGDTNQDPGEKIRCGSAREIPLEPLIFFHELAFYSFTLWLQEYAMHFYAQRESEQADIRDVFTSENATSNEVCPAGGNGNNSLVIGENAEEAASIWLGYMRLVSAVPAVLVTFLLLPLTDHIGRKFGIVLPNVGGLLLVIVCFIVIHCELNINYILIGVVLDGFLGRELLFLGSCCASFADSEPSKNRTVRYTIMSSVVFAAAAFGTLAIGHILSIATFSNSLLFPFFAYLVSTVYSGHHNPPTVAISEPLDKKGFLKQLTAGCKFLCLRNEQRTLGPERVVIIGAYLLASWIKFGNNDIEVLYAIGMPFCLNPRLLGYLRMTKAIAKATSLAIVALCLRRYFSDEALGIVACVAGQAGSLIMAFAANTIMIFSQTVVVGPSSFLLPLFKSMLSQLVSEFEQGSLFAFLSSMDAVSAMTSPPILNTIYSLTLSVDSRIIFFMFATFYTILVTVMTFLFVVKRRSRRHLKEPLLENDHIEAEGNSGSTP